MDNQRRSIPRGWRPRRRQGRCAAFVALLILVAVELHHPAAAFVPPASHRVSSHAVRTQRCSDATSSSSPPSADDDAEYDAIVIGSGMSGLCAGNHLAQRGRKVLMIESHSRPGGYCTNFQFRFEVSTHMLNGCGPDGTIGRILRDFGVDDSIEFKKLDTMLRWIDPARNINATLPVGIDAYVDTLCDLYPHEATGIREFHDRYYPLAAWVVEYEKKRGLSQVVHVLRNLNILWRLLSLRRKTAADILDPLIDDPACRDVLTVMTSLFGLHYTETDAAIFVMGSLMFHASGAYYPIGGSGKLSKVLANRFVECGGDLSLRTHVEGITFDENGIATGVTMKDTKGNVVSRRAKCVINCSDLSTLVDKMCPEDTFPQSFVNRVRNHTPGRSLVVAWAGLDVDLKAEGISDFEIIRTNGMSERVRDSRMLDDILKTADYENLPVSGATIYSNADPTCCKPGKSVVSTNFMASYDAFANTLDADGSHGDRYHELKDKVETQLLAQMAKATNIPNLVDHVEVMEVGTPITFQRYTENLGGSFMGWKVTPRQGAFSSFSPQTPVRNLLQCGQWLGVGGVASVMANGLDAAKIANRYLDRLERENRAEDLDEEAVMDTASILA